MCLFLFEVENYLPSMRLTSSSTSRIEREAQSQLSYVRYLHNRLCSIWLKFKLSWIINISRFAPIISSYTWVVCENNFRHQFSCFFRGKQMSELVIIKPAGKPLPFSFDILSTAFQYGNLCFTKYPADMADYFKQGFPDGMSYERSFIFEDGGVATASWNIRYKCNFFQLWHSGNIERRN